MTADERLMNEACREYEALLEDLIEGRLATEAADRVGKHLQGCPDCRASFRGAAQGTFLVRQVGEPAKEPTLGFARRTMAAIRGMEDHFAEEKRFWKPLAVLAWRVAMAATLSVLLLLAYATLPSFLPRQVSVVSQMTPQDIFPDPAHQPADRDEVLLLVAETSHGK